MDVTCHECNSFLRINPNLGATTVPCPRCGAAISVGKKVEAPVRRRAPKLELEEPDRTERDAIPVVERRKRPRKQKKGKKEVVVVAKPVRPRAPFTVWLLGTQLVILLIAALCLVGVYLGARSDLPRETFLHEPNLALVCFGLAMLFLCLFARRLPVLNSMIAALAVLGACAYNFYESHAIDASRVLLLSLAMTGVWLALQHRREIARREAPARS